MALQFKIEDEYLIYNDLKNDIYVILMFSLLEEKVTEFSR